MSITTCPLWFLQFAFNKLATQAWVVTELSGPANLTSNSRIFLPSCKSSTGVALWLYRDLNALRQVSVSLSRFTVEITFSRSWTQPESTRACTCSGLPFANEPERKKIHVLYICLFFCCLKKSYYSIYYY